MQQSFQERAEFRTKELECHCRPLVCTGLWLVQFINEKVSGLQTVSSAVSQPFLMPPIYCGFERKGFDYRITGLKVTSVHSKGRTVPAVGAQCAALLGIKQRKAQSILYTQKDFPTKHFSKLMCVVLFL